jgi:NADH-quinone oxidoreductase subunit L
VGAFTAGVFHVFTHAFFKALLFLGSGSVIHAMSGQQDMRGMGGLRKKIPITFATMLIGTLAIAGVPGLAGFFSKDEILWQAWSAHDGQFRVLWGLAFITALMTSFYMFRLIFMTFFGDRRMTHEEEHHLHESPRSMTIPLMVLAFCAIFAGYLGVGPSLGGSNHFEHFLAPVFENHAENRAGVEGAVAEASATNEKPGEKKEESGLTEYALMGLSVAAAFGGMFAGWKAYDRPGKEVREPINAVSPPVYRTLLNKYYVDELYDRLFTGRAKLGPVRLGAIGAGDAMWKFDADVIDGAVNGGGWMTRAAGRMSSWWDKWVVDGVGVNGPAIVVRMLSYPMRLVQAGLLQWYALVMVFGVAGLLWYYLLH